MALFYNPTVKKVKKPISKTAMKKNARELKKLFKELGMYDTETKNVLKMLNNLLEK